MNVTDPVLEKLRNLQDHLESQIRGQSIAVSRIVSLLKRGELSLQKPGRPRGSFLFLGPTGVGKTEVTVAFTEFLMGADRLHRFDMSEYQNQESLALLLGGKLGERGLLALAYDKSKTGTLLFDEIEKAHPRVLDIFLQILDAARATMANGETLDLSGFYVVFTSNIGSAETVDLEYTSYTTMERYILTCAQQEMRPELFARIGEKLVFNRLDYDTQLEIAEVLLAREVAFLHQSGHTLVADESVLPFLVNRGFHPRLGARPMRDAIEKAVGDAVAASLLAGNNGSGRLSADPNGESLVIHPPDESRL